MSLVEMRAVVLAFSEYFGVLNHDLQDFEDFLVLGVGLHGARCSLPNTFLSHILLI